MNPNNFLRMIGIRKNIHLIEEQIKKHFYQTQLPRYDKRMCIEYGGGGNNLRHNLLGGSPQLWRSVTSRVEGKKIANKNHVVVCERITLVWTRYILSFKRMIGIPTNWGTNQLFLTNTTTQITIPFRNGEKGRIKSRIHCCLVSWLGFLAYSMFRLFWLSYVACWTCGTRSLALRPNWKFAFPQSCIDSVVRPLSHALNLIVSKQTR